MATDGCLIVSQFGTSSEKTLPLCTVINTFSDPLSQACLHKCDVFKCQYYEALDVIRSGD